jgi:hypothetical protein
VTPFRPQRTTGPRSAADQLRFLARSRAGAPVVEAVTLRALNLRALQRALGPVWFMVDHAGLAEGLPKTVFAACTQEMLDAVLGHPSTRDGVRPKLWLPGS